MNAGMRDKLMEGWAELAATAAYVKAGRQFETLGLDALTSRYLIAAETAVAAPTLPTIKLIDDLTAEFELRGSSPPTWVFSGHKVQLAELRDRAVATACEEFEEIMRRQWKPG
jgi:hypothetical protein